MLDKRVKQERRWVRTGVATTMIGLMIVMVSSPVFALDTGLAQTRLVINIPSYTLSMFSGEKIVKTYPVAVGKPTAQTPVGKFRILNKMINPTWYPPAGGKIVPPGPENPLGRRWLGFLPNGYGIHGNNNSSSIGQAVSLGCVRMHNADVEELFAQISIGTELEIKYDTIDVALDPTTGQTNLIFYPDIYGRGTTVEMVKNKLQENAFLLHFSPEEIEAIIDGVVSTPVYLSLGMRVQAGPKEFVVDTIIHQGETLMAARPLLEALNLPIAWDPIKMAVIGGGTSLTATVRKGRSFIRLIDLEQELGLHSYWHEPEQMLKLFSWRVVSKGKLAGGAWIDEDKIWLPASALIGAEEGAGLTIIAGEKMITDGRNRNWSGKLVGGELYIRADDLIEMVPAKVRVLTSLRQIEILPLKWQESNPGKLN